MLYISIVQKWITGHGTFQQAPTEHHFKSYSLLKQMYRVSKNECFCNVKEAYGQKNASEHFPLNSVWMVFITFGSLFVPGFLWLIWIKDCRPEIKTGCGNRKIEIWKLASKVQFLFSVNIENRYQILSFVFLVD